MTILARERFKTNLYDNSKCSACRGCIVACKDSNQLPGKSDVPPSSFVSGLTEERFRGNYSTKESTDGNTFTILTYNEHVDPAAGLHWNFLKFQCMHCIEPQCEKVCPQNAYTKNEWGATVQDPSKCIGCQYCVTACPFEIPKYRKHTDTITKCTLCVERVNEGLKPACARTCPTGALTFGYRDELLLQARERVKFLQANGFPRATIYGENELGSGTNKLYVLTDTPDKFGLPVDPKIEGNTIFWQDWVKPYAGWLIPIALAGSAISFVTSRLVANKQGDHSEGGHE
jgi:formate dehydrogenase iron-sulfur subunit